MGLKVKKVADKTGERPPAGMPWPLASVRLQGPLPERHRFPRRWLANQALDGWVTISGGRITLRLEDGDATYRVLSGPGVYCLYCDERIADAPADQQNYPDAALRQAEAERQQQHVRACSGGEPSPDPREPSGRKHCAYYDAELER